MVNGNLTEYLEDMRMLYTELRSKGWDLYQTNLFPITTLVFPLPDGQREMGPGGLTLNANDINFLRQNNIFNERDIAGIMGEELEVRPYNGPEGLDTFNTRSLEAVLTPQAVIVHQMGADVN